MWLWWFMMWFMMCIWWYDVTWWYMMCLWCDMMIDDVFHMICFMMIHDILRYDLMKYDAFYDPFILTWCVLWSIHQNMMCFMIHSSKYDVFYDPLIIIWCVLWSIHHNMMWFMICVFSSTCVRISMGIWHSWVHIIGYKLLFSFDFINRWDLHIQPSHIIKHIIYIIKPSYRS